MTPDAAIPRAERQPARLRAERLLAQHGAKIESVPGVSGGSEAVRLPALATAMMDLFRRTGSEAAYECLVQLAGTQLYARVRSRLRFLGARLDPHELLQDTLINIYRYPDKFDACRPGAFAAWSSTIVDNTIRRQLRRSRGPEVALSPSEILSQHADVHAREPGMQAQDREECATAMQAFSMFLAVYLQVFQTLSERERFVLQMVEVRQLRYAELAIVLGIRHEALKMVVFRARKRILDRIAQLFGDSRATVPQIDRRPAA